MLKKLLFIIKREGGLLGFLQYVALRLHLKKKTMRVLISPIAIPIALMIALIEPWIRIRIILLFSNRIGHYPYNTDLLLYVLKRSLDAKDQKSTVWFYTVPGAPICNEQLHLMWMRTIIILPFPYIVAEIDRYLLSFSSWYRNDPIKKFFMQSGYSWDAWNLISQTHESHLVFTEEEKKRGQMLLEAMGIPHDAKWVCIHGRDSRYLSIYMPHQDFSYTNYRNVDINHYAKAALYLAEKGYYVLRMGKHVQDKFNVNHPRVIDYANSPFLSDFADIYLSAYCFFFVSVGSGLDSVAQIFRRPILQTNITLVDPDFHPDWHLLITKKMRRIKDGKYLSLRNVADEFPWEKCNKARAILQIAEEKWIESIENTPDEILAVVKEMLARLTGTYQIKEEDEALQQELWQSFKEPGMRMYSASPPPIDLPLLKTPVFEGQNIDLNRKISHVRLRMGADFLKDNQSWLIDSHNQQISLFHHIPLTEGAHI